MEQDIYTQLSHLARELVDTIDLPLQVKDEEIHLRIEIFRCLHPGDQYCARVWRYEYYRIQSTFPQTADNPLHAPSDELILKEFEGFDCPLRDLRQFDSVDVARNYLLEQIAAWLRDQVGVTRIS